MRKKNVLRWIPIPYINPLRYVGGFWATHLKNMLVNLDHETTPSFEGEHKNIWNRHHRSVWVCWAYGPYNVSSKGFKTIT